MFELREKYGVGTFYSKHEAVNTYIKDTVQSLHAWFMKDLIEWIAIAVYECQSQKSIARYVFETSVVARNEEDVNAASLACVDNAFRAHLCRVLSNRGATDVRDESADEKRGDQSELSFDYVVGTKGVHTDENWMPADGGERREPRWRSGTAEEGGPTAPPVAVPPAHAVCIPLKDADLASATLRLRSRLESA